jgi:hypothetical protein
MRLMAGSRNPDRTGVVPATPALPLLLDEVNGLAEAQKAARLGDASTVPC